MSEEAKKEEPEKMEDVTVKAEKTELGRGRPWRFMVPVFLILAIGGLAVWYFLLRSPQLPANQIEVSGRVETDDSAVAAKTGGKIREITVREGDSVTAGQIIAVLDDEQLKAREDQARAEVKQTETLITRARQQIEVLQEQLDRSQVTVEQSRLDARGRVNQAEAQVAQAEAQLAQAEANLKQARYDEEKFMRLFKTGDVSERQAKQAQTNAESQARIVQAQQKQVAVARGALTAARSSLANPTIRSLETSAIKKQIAQAESDIDSARAESERAQGRLEEVQAGRDDLKVVAPFDGIVATRTAEPGEVVAAGAAIVTLFNPNLIYLRAFVPEGDIGRVRIGQPARVYLDSSPDQPFEAEVTRIDPESAFTPENTYFRDERVKQVVGVKLSIKDPRGLAKPGMPADGEILVSGQWTGSGRVRAR